MNRPRRHNRHLPRNVYLRHGAYWLVRRGKWTKLGRDLRGALSQYAALYEAPQGSMPSLIAAALPVICARVKPSTAKQYALAARKLAAVFVEFEPGQVRQSDVAAYKLAGVKTPNMTNRCISLLRLVFEYAVENQIVTANPVIGIRRHREHKRERLITGDELRAIYAHAGPRLRIIIDLLIRTGQRVQDVLRIRRADLLEAGIRFQQQKTDAKLIVPWTPELRAVVAEARHLYGNLTALTLVHNRRGKAPDYRTVRDQWDRACRAAGVADAHLHDLRAVAGTESRRQGKNATELLGHKTEAQTVRYLRDKAEVIAEGPSFGHLLDIKR